MPLYKKGLDTPYLLLS